MCGVAIFWKSGWLLTSSLASVEPGLFCWLLITFFLFLFCFLGFFQMSLTNFLFLFISFYFLLRKPHSGILKVSLFPTVSSGSSRTISSIGEKPFAPLPDYQLDEG